MKSLVALVFVTLMCILHQDSADAKSPPVPLPEECCLTISDKSIPKKMVRSVTKTPSDCKGHKAFIVTTVKQRKICVDPNCEWVKTNQSFLDKLLKK